MADEKPVNRKLSDSKDSDDEYSHTHQTVHSLSIKVNLPEEKIKEIDSAFQLFDSDCDGKITTLELKKVLNTLNYFPTPEDLTNMISLVDSSKDGAIDFNEFLALMCDKMGQSDSEEEVLEAFRIFDKTNKGYVTEADFKKIMKDLGETIADDELEELMKDCDEDRDGQLNYEEFKKMMSF